MSDLHPNVHTYLADADNLIARAHVTGRSMNLDAAVSIVTGASGGIGNAIALGARRARWPDRHHRPAGRPPRRARRGHRTSRRPGDDRRRGHLIAGDGPGT